MSTSITGPRRIHPPTYRLLLAAVVVLCTGVMALNLVMAIRVGVVDEGPRTLQQQLAGVLGFGVIGLAVSLAAAGLLGSHPRRRRVGAVALGVLCVPSVVFFFSGLPGMLGATAAYLAGLTAGRETLDGAARSLGVVGLAIAVLNITVCLVGVTVAWLA